MNKKNLISNIFLSVVLVMVWSAILFATFLLWFVSDVFRLLGNGILVYTFVFIYILAFAVPIIFRKSITKYISLPLSFIVFAIISIIMVSFVFVGARSYISSFSQEKWNYNEMLRFYMIDDLEKNHQIIGRTENEIIELLGKPTYTYDNTENTYEYLVGFNMIDSIGYQIEFEKDVAKDTRVVQH